MPDIKSVYVVEKLIKGTDLTQNPASPAPDQWLGVGTYDNAQEAVRHAQDPSIKENTRVRVFKVEYGPTITVAGVQSKTDTVVPAEAMTEYRCLDHPERTMKGYEPGRCPDCRKEMVPATFGDNVKDWTQR